MPKPPRAEASERSIVLAGRSVTYRLARSCRKTIGLAIDQRGLRVGAPTAARLGEIEALLRQHGDWVLAKLDAWQQRPPPQPVTVVDGLGLPWLGGDLRIGLQAGGRRAVWSDDGLHLTLSGMLPGSRSGAPAADAAALLEPTEAAAAQTELRRRLEAALRERIRAVFASRLRHLAPLLGVEVPPLALSSARTRWGSCSSRGGIRLNWRLGFFPLAVIDYVVAHELAHLKEMNHGPRFWSLVETLCPDWRLRRAELKALGPTCPLF